MDVKFKMIIMQPLDYLFGFLIENRNALNSKFRALLIWIFFFFSVLWNILELNLWLFTSIIQRRWWCCLTDTEQENPLGG